MQLGSPRACGGRFQQTRTFTSLLHRRQKPFTSICHPPRSNGPTVPAIAPKEGGVECRGSVQPRQPGQLGIVASSARFKRDIQAMGEASQSLLQLRPVTFRYKQDPQATRQYGDRRGSGQSLSGAGHTGARWASVQYHELISMLLNELQRQQREFQELKAGLMARLTQLEAAVPRSASLAGRSSAGVDSIYGPNERSDRRGGKS